MEKKQKIKCSEPEILLDSQNGSIIKTCVSSSVPEWKSLSLLGKQALTNSANKASSKYNRLYQTEQELGLQLYSEARKIKGE